MSSGRDRPDVLEPGAPVTVASVPVQEAAAQIGVSVRHVQHLMARGDLARAAHGEVDVTSVDRYRLTVAGTRRRPWTEPTAWAAVAILGGRPSPWLGPSQRSRLRAQLRELDADALVSFSRHRARPHRFAGHPVAAAAVTRTLVPVTRPRRRDDGVVNGYSSPAIIEQLAHDQHLVESPRGLFIARATTFDLDEVRRLSEASEVLAALDDASEIEHSEAARDLLTEILDRHRRSRSAGFRH